MKPFSARRINLFAVRAVPTISMLVIGCLVTALVWAGPLTPPAGPVTGTYKTLSEVEPRTAISSANTPGDGDSTFRISQPGSYYLTGNITGEATKKGIELAIAGGAQVTIDLNGFTMTGTGATSTQAAIFIDGASANVTVRNGAIRSWRNAVNHFVGGNITLEDVHAFGSTLIQFDLRNATVVRCFADDGANAGFFVDGGTLTDCTARSNNGTGFTINSAATIVRGCNAVGNGAGGFNLGQGVAESCRAASNTLTGFTNPGAMSNCVALSNTGDGIFASFSAVIRGCNATGNGGDGIQVNSGSRVEGNTISSSNFHGVNVSGSRSTVVGNTISNNGRATGSFAGVLVAGTDNSIDGNHITEMLLAANDFGISVTGTSNLIVRNQISAVSTPLSIAAGNSSGGASTTPATATAWSNITY